MKNNLHHKVHTAAKDIRLSHTERDLLRASLRAHMDTVSVTIPPTPTRSPYQFFFMHRVLAVVALLVVVVVGAGGTSVAAQWSLPGDLLYPVKISVNEEVQAALAVSPVAKAQVHAALAERRIEEAQTLAARGTLDATTTQEIQKNFDEHAGIAQTIARDLATTEPAVSTQLSTQFSSSLSVDDAVLTSLVRGSSNQALRYDTNELSRTVQTNIVLGPSLTSLASSTDTHTFSRTNDTHRTHRRTKDEGTRSGIDAHVDMTASTTSATTTPAATTTVDTTSVQTQTVTTDAATQLGESAKQVLADTQAQYAKLKNSLSLSTTDAIDARLAAVQSQLNLGDTALAAGNTDEAYADYTSAMGAATRLQTLLKASKRFRSNILQQLFDTTDSSGEVLGTSTVSNLPDPTPMVDGATTSDISPDMHTHAFTHQKHRQ